MRKDVKKVAAYYSRKFGTCDPFKIAVALNIELAIGDMGSREGCYMYLKKHKCIFLNEHLDDTEARFVMAHELGHAIMHPKENCYFIRNKTLLLTSKTEIEANQFAVSLLLPDDVLSEYAEYGYTVGQISRITGYHERLIELRLNLR